VSLLLLTVAGGSALRLVRAGLVAADRVAFAAHGREALRDAAERVHADPCGAPDGERQFGRQRAEWSATGGVGLASGAFGSWFTVESGLGTAPRPLDAVFAGWCP
jgi:hypothetical protein